MRTDTDDDPRWSAYQRFRVLSEWPMLVASLAFLALMLVRRLATLSPTGDLVVTVLDVAIWGLFVVEFVVLFVLAPVKRVMLRRHWLEAIIILAPALRPLRLLRLARVLMAAGLFGRALGSVSAITQRRGLQSFLAVALVIVVLSALLVWLFESEAVGSNIDGIDDALWWAFVTATTVGYGDHTPVSSEGQVVAVLLMLLGVSVFGVLTANIAAFFIERAEEPEREAEREEVEEVGRRLERIEALLASSLMPGDELGDRLSRIEEALGIDRRRDV